MDPINQEPAVPVGPDQHPKHGKVSRRMVIGGIAAAGVGAAAAPFIAGCDSSNNNASDGGGDSQWHTTALCSPTRSCFLTGAITT